jgi:hypothetical protein
VDEDMVVVVVVTAEARIEGDGDISRAGCCCCCCCGCCWVGDCCAEGRGKRGWLVVEFKGRLGREGCKVNMKLKSYNERGEGRKEGPKEGRIKKKRGRGGSDSALVN